MLALLAHSARGKVLDAGLRTTTMPHAIEVMLVLRMVVICLASAEEDKSKASSHSCVFVMPVASRMGFSVMRMLVSNLSDHCFHE